MEPASPPSFESLGHAGLQNFAGLETFANPGVERVEMTSDELAALCPITLQPDMYVATIAYRPQALCLESKSVKLYLMQFRNEGQFCEALTVRIRDDVAAALEVVPELERTHGQPHVVGIGVREAEGARLVTGAAEVVPDRVLLEQRHAPAALGEDARRGRAHGARADHDSRAAAVHATSRRRSASTAPSRSACTESAT